MQEKKAQEPKVSRRQFSALAGGLSFSVIAGTGLGTLEGCQTPDIWSESSPERVGKERGTEPQVHPNEKPKVSNESVGNELHTEPPARPPFDGGHEQRAEPPSVPDKAAKEEEVWEGFNVDLKGRKYVVVELSSNKGLYNIGGRATVPLPEDISILFRRTKYTFDSISLTCTHNGCTVGWRPDRFGFVCPCHIATFDYKGRVTGGPARRDLKTYSTAYDAVNEKVYVFVDR